MAQVYRLEREIQWRRGGTWYRTSREVEFGITSLARNQASPSLFPDFATAINELRILIDTFPKSGMIAL